jgi:MYXO-CTERM domain-containing protein
MSRATPTVIAMLGFLPIVAVVMAASGRAEAATPTYYNNLPAFQADITNTVTDTYSNAGYVFSQSNVVMSGVLGETDYVTTGHNNNNLVFNAPADPRYCAGCNGSFELQFQTTSVGDASGVHGVGVFIEAHDMGTPYFAFITFADGTTANIALPGVGNFWGVAAPERIERIHFGLSMGGITQGGSFAIDDLIIGSGAIGACMSDADCFDDADPCTDQVCNAGMCTYPFNVAPCDDGEVCTENDVCSLGTCQGSLLMCDDGNACTTDFCDFGVGCATVLNMDPCDDGNACTEMDVCSGGTCSGSGLDCNDDDVCTMESCDPATGCASEPVPGCCTDDGDCGPDETCDLDANACVPIPGGSGSEGGETGDTGQTGGETGPGTGQTGDTGVDGTGGDSGVVTGASETEGADTGIGGSMGDATGIGLDTGLPDAPFDPGCGCTTDSSPKSSAWWSMLVLGALTWRRRRSRS